MDTFRLNPRENTFLIESAMSILGLSKDKYNAEVFGEYKIIAVCLAYFGSRKHDETDNSKEITKLKFSMVNSFNHKLKGDNVLEEQLRSWRKHDIGDSLHRDCSMNDVIVCFLCSMLNQKKFIFIVQSIDIQV